MNLSTTVANFLKEFKAKMKIWDVVFRDERGKNAKALAELEITPSQRKQVLEKLETEDYCEGPLKDTLYKGSDMWVFGKLLKGKELYIKITMGVAGSSVLCISFHLAEHAMKYPLKT